MNDLIIDCFAGGGGVMENSDCDFVETTERGNYCCLKHCACTVEKCEVLKYGLGKEDLEIAAEDMMLLKANMNR